MANPAILSILPYIASLFGGAAAGYFSAKPQQSNITTTGGQGNPLTGYSAAAQQLPRFTPEQQGALNTLLQRGLEGSDFGGIEKYHRKQFAEQTVPSIAERFTALGSGGSQRSSAFAGLLGNAASNLESNLANLKSQYGLQQAGLGLTPSFENIYIPAQQGFAQPLAQGIAASIPQALQSYFSPNDNNNVNELVKLLQNLSPDKLQQIKDIIGAA